MLSRIKQILSISLILTLSTSSAIAENWPSFRGPNANGITADKNLPVEWNENTNVAWKVKTLGYGHSSPVVWKNQIWMGTAMDEGHSLHAICYDRTGKLQHNVKLFSVDNLQASNALNSFASPTPAIEDDTVYVYFGTYGVAAIDTSSGKIRWKRTDINLNHQEGPGSSPILYKDLLIFHCDGYDVQYITALNKKTGKTTWKTKRSIDLSGVGNHARKAFVTPAIQKINNADLLVSPAAQGCYAYDPNTGKEVWRISYSGFSAVPQPVFSGGTAFVVTDFGRPEIWALNSTAKGILADGDVSWRYSMSCPSTPSLTVINGLIYFVADKTGVASCITAKTGELVWRSRVGGSFSASPIATDEHIYFFDRDGTTTVVRLGDSYDVVSQNKLDAGCMASPAVADDAIYIRTTTHLYCIKK